MLNNIVIFSIVALFLSIIIYLLYPTIKNSFTDRFNGSGYGMNQKFGEITTLIPLNNVSRSTDFKLLSLMSQIRFSFVLPPKLYEITRTNDGIINRTPKQNTNIILFPGLSDYILRQNGREVWPRQFEKMNDKDYTVVYDNNKGHFNSITTLFENLNYIEGENINTIKYDFRKLDFEYIFNNFLSYLKPNTVIIAYDFGCVIANMCINFLKNQNKSENLHKNIKKFLLICPTIGGTPMTLRDYFSGNGIIDPSLIKNFDSLIMSMPNKKFYDNPVAIYNSISYNANNINELMKYQNKPSNFVCISYNDNNINELIKYKNNPSNLFYELLEKQEYSFENPDVDCIIISSDQFSTPIAYNFNNNLTSPPERYLPINNNQQPNSDIKHNGTFEGIQTKGDRVVPISSIYKLVELWKGKNNTINIELIKDKDHFTILQSYELALIIMANIK